MLIVAHWNWGNFEAGMNPNELLTVLRLSGDILEDIAVIMQLKSALG